MKKTIGLIDIDSTIPNLALMKISAYHKRRGNDVILLKNENIWINHQESLFYLFDKVYISCIFEENARVAKFISKQFRHAQVGGVGVNKKRLAPTIEHIMPDYDLYPNMDYSLGFTTRGCIRDCYFCKVRQHEGYISEHCDIYEFWDKKHKKVLLLDNNILALPKHFKKIAKQIKDNNLSVDFNQGLDHRLLTPELCNILLDLKISNTLRFAFDKIEYKNSVLKSIKMLKKAGLKDWGARWYLYIGINDTFDTVYKRMNILREQKQNVYVMRDRKVYGIKEFIALSMWGNGVGAFKSAPFEKVLQKSKRLEGYRDRIEELMKKSNK